MKSKKSGIRYSAFIIIFICITGCTIKEPNVTNTLPDNEAAINYLKELKGKWKGAQVGTEKEFGWEFDLTSKEEVIIERIKVGTPRNANGL